MNPDLGNNARLLASVEGIVNSLFNRRQESFSRIIEAKQVPVLREKFADGYVALFCRHRLGRDGAALWLSTCLVDVRHICVFFHFAGLYFGTPRALEAREQTPKTNRQFSIVRRPYRWVRHPWYLAAIMLFRSCVDFTSGRLLFNVLSTAWVCLGVNSGPKSSASTRLVFQMKGADPIVDITQMRVSRKSH